MNAGRAQFKAANSAPHAWTMQQQQNRVILCGSSSDSRRSVVRLCLLLGMFTSVQPRQCIAIASGGDLDIPPPIPTDAVFEPGGAVLAAQRAAADAERDSKQSVSGSRRLTLSDAEAMLQLTDSEGWENSLKDLQLLLGMPGAVFGIFSGSAQLVSMCCVTYFPANGAAGAAFLSYVVTRKDFRRRGLARQTCEAALNWIDSTHPSCSIGLYGESITAAPL